MEGGELIEDAEYEAAKNEQAFVEGRIQDLEILLANARVIEDTGNNRRLSRLARRSPFRKKAASRKCTPLSGLLKPTRAKGKISNESPLGRALMDHRAGDKVRRWTLPAGLSPCHH
jgi:transcription elongation factor GreA